MRLGGFKIPNSKRLSATSISTFVTCPEQFRRKYLLKHEERNTGERFVGSVTHKALHSLFDPAFYADTDGTPATAVDQAWQEAIENDGEPDWFEKDAAEMYRRTKLMVATYMPVAQEYKPIAVEQFFEETIAGVEVIGRIDKELDDRILEVKTAATKLKKPKSRWSFQGRLYSLVSNKPVEWHIVTRQATPQIVTAEEAPDLYVASFNKDATVQIVTQAVHRMSDYYVRYGPDNPWPIDGIFGDWACSYCSFKKGCPAWKS